MRDKKKTSAGPLDSVSAFAYRLFGKQAMAIAAKKPSLNDDILRSNMRITPDGLVAIAILGLLVGGVGFVIEILVATAIFTWIPVYVTIIFAFLPLMVFLSIVYSPKFSANSRAASLDNELPFLVGFIVVLAGGGVSPIASIRRISEMSSLFPSSSREARRILIDIDVFGLDPISALEKAAKYIPNKKFSEFLYGYTTVIKTGGDIASYLNTKLKEIYDARTIQVKKASDTIGTLAEGYVTITSVLGISLFVIFQSQALISHSSSGIQGIEIFGMVGIPMFSLLFIYLLNAVQARYPYVDYAPYKVFGYFAPLGIGSFVVMYMFVPMSLFMKTSLALVAMTAFPAVYALRASRERRALEKALPDFIRDIAEGRKIGLSPEQTIQGLADKHYGALSKHVAKMGSQLSWGVALSQVVTTFVSEVKSWVTRETGTLLAEVIDVGGGTVKSFSDMADFTNRMNELEAEKRGSLRPYLFINYFSAIMVVVTTFIMVYFVSTPINFGTRTVTPPPDTATIDILLTIAVFESWVIGIVAGKMGEGSVADGFKHALALVIIAIAAVYIAEALMGIKVA